jgi:hypothetical protein
MGLTKPRAYQIFDIDYKQSVRVITLTNISLTGGAPSSVDGVNLSAGDRILVAGQGTGSQNGLYQVSVLGTGENGTWIRSVDANQTGEIDAGMIVMVTEGEVYKDTQWKLTTNDPITIGVTDLVFEQNSAFAFGNIYANGTAVLADIVGDTVTFTPANNLVILANATTDTISFEVSQSPNFTGNFQVSGTVGSNLIPTGNIVYNLGNTTNRWNDLWLSNSTIYLGNAQISANATSLILTNPEGAQTVFSGSVANIIAGTVTATGNVTGGNLSTSGILSVTGNANVGNIGATNANVTAITATGNANVGNLGTAGLVTATGNITGGNLITAGQVVATGNISASTFIGNISGNIDAGGANTNIQFNDDDILNGSAAFTFDKTSNAVTATGNISAGNIITGGVIDATGNITGGNITTAGNVSANYFLGNVACASGIFTTKIFNGNSEANIVSAGGNLEISIGGVDDIVIVTSSGLQTTGTLTATGNITGGNIATAGVITATGNVTGGNLVTTGNVVAGNLQVSGIEAVTTLNVSGDTTIVGNLTVSGTTITANVSSLVVTDPILGLGRGANGDPLTSNDGLDRGIEMFYYNTAERIAFMGFDNNEGKMISAANASIANNIVTVNSYGTTVVGTLEAEVASVTGNVSGGNINTTGLTSTATLNSSGNANVGNLGTAGSITATGNIDGGNVNTGGQIIATGNVTAGGFFTAGNVTAGYFFGNVSSASGIFTTKIFNGNSEANIVSAGGNLEISIGGVDDIVTVTSTGLITTGTLTATSNITGGNLVTAGSLAVTGNANVGNIGAVEGVFTGAVSGSTTITATGNVTGGNLVTAGQVSATGNVTGNFFVGNGSALTGINAFGTFVVAGSNSVIADSTSDTLTLVAGDGVVITTSAGTDTITISTSGSSESIFITGGDMGTVDEVVTQEQDLGLITTAVALEIDMGFIVTAGVLYPDQLVLPSKTVAELGNLSAVPAGQFVYCTNESGGSIPAFSDGTNWRRVTDRAIVT